MKVTGLFLTAFILIISAGCRHDPDTLPLLMKIENELGEGNLARVKIMVDSLKSGYPDDQKLVRRADSLSMIAERTGLDFSVNGEMIDIQLKERIGEYSAEEREGWENKGWLEWRKINGEKMYFNRAASNLILLKSFHLQREVRDSAESGDQEMLRRKINTRSIIRESYDNGSPVVPAEMIISYTLTVAPDAVPPGETVRCWLPYPREDHPRQQSVRFISASYENFLLAPDSAVHRTIYMEAKAEKSMPLIFKVSYSYKSFGQYFKPDLLTPSVYNSQTELHGKFTREQLPHICFTDRVRSLTDSIVGAVDNPAEIVNRVYHWFSKNIPWAGALEYSIIPDIPGYVIENRRGDCGMQTFLFMSMLRYKGIPVRWQSGWKVPPEGKNLHDWCEVYYEGIGWVPADVSYGLQYSNDMATREFFISGIDSYRLIINNDIAGRLYPEKRYLRSEPYDFQRGEVEWTGGNLYFDKWDYEMKIEYN